MQMSWPSCPGPQAASQEAVPVAKGPGALPAQRERLGKWEEIKEPIEEERERGMTLENSKVRKAHGKHSPVQRQEMTKLHTLLC